eukprot:5116716-Lingulodinium_polyedra.AAC.1
MRHLPGRRASSIVQVAGMRAAAPPARGVPVRFAGASARLAAAQAGWGHARDRRRGCLRHPDLPAMQAPLASSGGGGGDGERHGRLA